MHDFLTTDVDFDNFPPDFGKYVKGMPIQTFKAILQNISTRIQLYQFAHGGNYNTRSVSTLPNESFFFRSHEIGQRTWLSQGLQYT